MAQTGLLILIVLQLCKVDAVIELSKFVLASKFYSIECLGIVTELLLNLTLLEFIDLTLNVFKINTLLTCSTF